MFRNKKGKTNAVPYIIVAVLGALVVLILMSECTDTTGIKGIGASAKKMLGTFTKQTWLCYGCVPATCVEATTCVAADSTSVPTCANAPTTSGGGTCVLENNVCVLKPKT